VNIALRTAPTRSCVVGRPACPSRLVPVPAVLIPILVLEADFRSAQRSSILVVIPSIAAIVPVTINVLIVAARSPIATDRTMVFIHHSTGAVPPPKSQRWGCPSSAQ
jgi:hypothetical protein